MYTTGINRKYWTIKRVVIGGGGKKYWTDNKWILNILRGGGVPRLDQELIATEGWGAAHGPGSLD